MVRGVQQPLQLEDVFQLTWWLRPAVCCDALQRAWEQVGGVWLRGIQYWWCVVLVVFVIVCST